MRQSWLAAGSLLYCLGCRADAVEVRREQKCDGMAFAAHCGDLRCEPSRGESEVTCPADCVEAEIKSYNYQTICSQVVEVLSPSSVEQVEDVVARAARERRRVRVVGRLHSANEQLCTDGYVISTERMNQALYLETFEGVETVVTQPGIRMGDLTDWLGERGRSLGFAVLGTRDPSIAGAIATASHGSSPRHSAVLSSLVQSVEIVTADAQTRLYTRDTTDPSTWKALTANLGMLGVVTELRLRVQPQFNLDVLVSFHDDAELGRGRGPVAYVDGCDYGQLNWFPGQHKVVKTCGVVTDLPAQEGATNRLLSPDFKRWVSGPAERALQYGRCNEQFNCAVLERARYRQFRTSPPFFRTITGSGGSEPSRHVVGRSNRMMSSELTDAQDGMFQRDFELAVPAQHAAAAFATARRHFDRAGICLPLVGVFIRFSPIEDEAWLAHTSTSEVFHTGDPVVFFEMPVFVPVGVPPEQVQAMMDDYEALVRTLIEEHGARPHWGKNDLWVFELERSLGLYGERFDRFVDVVHELDPDGVFANEWSLALGLRRAGPDAVQAGGTTR